MNDEKATLDKLVKRIKQEIAVNAKYHLQAHDAANHCIDKGFLKEAMRIDHKREWTAFESDLVAIVSQYTNREGEQEAVSSE